MFTKPDSFFKSLLRELSNKEKAIVGILAIAAITSGAFLIYQTNYYNTVFAPDYGGTYREGIVSQKSSDLQDTINRLTKIGLTKFDENGNVVPEVATTWEISEDVTTYIFTISEKFPRDDVIAKLQKQKDKFSGIAIESIDNNKIKFSFPQSYSPFLAESTEPILDYGPYKQVKETSSQIDFNSRNDFYLGKPYIEKISLKIYPDVENLQKAFRAGEIDVVYNSQGETWEEYNAYQFNLPRYNIIFFNTSREVVKDKQTRQKIANGEKFDETLKLMIVSLDSDKYHKTVEDLLVKWQEQNIQADVYYKSANELTNTIIPKRDYDVLVYGLDYGRDPDPYPFWHSTQTEEGGFNLSNFSHIDADKAIEEARQTKDQGKRQEKLAEFQKYFDEEKPAIIISQDQWQFAVSNKVKGIETNYSVTPADRYIGVEKWYIKEKRVKK